MKMRYTTVSEASYAAALLQLLIVVIVCSATQFDADLMVDASNASERPIPETLFGIFFEEINHAGAGGLWAELVGNRGDESSINVATDGSSLFERNKVALRLEVLCDTEGDNICPADGVGVYYPGFWGMNIEQGMKYKVIFYVRSTGSINISVSLIRSNGVGNLASTAIIAPASEVSNWTKVETLLEATATNHNSRLQLTTTTRGVIWFDQVSAMPLDTYKVVLHPKFVY